MGAAAVAATNPARANPTLVDTKGLGKLPPLKNTQNEFVSWARRTENFVVSVHPGARDVLTWAVESESATVTEANAATEVVMPLDTVRMLADQLYTVLMTLVEGESFDILVGSGSGEGLEAWRGLHKNWGPLAKLGEFTRSSGNGWGVTQKDETLGTASDTRLQRTSGWPPWKYSFLNNSSDHCQFQRSRLDTNQKLKEEVVLYAEARGYVAPKLGQVANAREDRNDPMDVGGRPTSKRKVKNPMAKGKDQERMVQSHQDK